MIIVHIDENFEPFKSMFNHFVNYSFGAPPYGSQNYKKFYQTMIFPHFPSLNIYFENDSVVKFGKTNFYGFLLAKYNQ